MFSAYVNQITYYEIDILMLQVKEVDQIIWKSYNTLI